MKTITKKVATLMVAALFLFLAACAPSNNETPVGAQNQTPSADAGLANTTWRLVSYGPPNAETQVIGEIDITLEFDGGLKAGGFSGCNTYGAEYEVIGDNRISIDDIFATEIACEAEGIMDQELQYFEALRSAHRFEVSGDMLTIWYGDGQNALNFSRLAGSTPVPVTPSPNT